MSVKINYKNQILISKDDPSFEKVKDLLTIVENEKKPIKQFDSTLNRLKTINKSIQVTKYLYKIDNEHLIIQLGLLPFIKHLFTNSEIIDNTKYDHSLYCTNKYVENINNYRTILSGISLYDYQIDAIKEMLIHKHGVINAATGAGKTEIMCGFIEILKDLNNNKYPTTLILEPTLELLNGIKKRFKSYKIPINDYRESRMIMSNKVNIGHPTSIVNDLKADKRILNKVEVQLMDECHHSSCKTWQSPAMNMENLLYSFGLSATFVSHYHKNGKHIDDFSYEELKRIGTCGQIIYNIEAKELIKDKHLAYPKLVILDNKADEPMPEESIDYNWQNVKKIRMQSIKRTKIIAETACILAKHNRKVIILMNVLDWGRSILKEIYNLGYGNVARNCFGGRKYEKINKRTGKIEVEYNDVLEMFNKNKINVIIGSSCLQEGIDLSCVDCCILSQGGRGDRTSLQSIGRAMRKSKTGKYGYIVDINDSQDRMLNNQYRERMIKYKKILNIKSSNDIIKNCTPEQFEDKFKLWEELT